MADLWKLSAAERQAVLGVDAKTYAAYKKNPSSLSRAALERISLTLGLYRRLNEILSSPASNDWIKRPNKAFGGKPALTLMMRDSAGLREVRNYLLSVGGGWF